MKQSMVDIFAELGQRLSAFGEDASSREVARQAVEANSWFTADEVLRAARALARQMLSGEALAAWLAGYPALPVGEPRGVLIVMAGNIPLVGFQDLLCVLVAGHRAVVKPSSKDSVLMRWLIAELRDIEPEIPISLFEAGDRPDAVVAMGGDDAVRTLGSMYEGVPALLRGSRWSVAVLEGGETPEQLSALADDVFAYSGLGCRNVSLVLMPEEFDITRLKNALRSYPRPINPKYANNYRQTKALLSINGAEFIDCGHCVMCEEWDFPASVSRINYGRYSSAEDISELLAAHEAEIQCIVGSIDHPRAVDFGESQSPTLTDYPDGRDTMQFLASI
ncbi:MAG: aldehyde dehydrogenase [Rikenellaceae bacterium]|nr:aldehyde dehydrogenase [Rikenellaceae bacterium]